MRGKNTNRKNSFTSQRRSEEIPSALMFKNIANGFSLLFGQCQ